MKPIKIINYGARAARPYFCRGLSAVLLTQELSKIWVQYSALVHVLWVLAAIPGAASTQTTCLRLQFI
jgi:hypothetical protein